ncbi:DDX20 helicase, partial [Lophotis ruficrista]|nr:DDX20 helicase [Lophotis ruficrista]
MAAPAEAQAVADGRFRTRDVLVPGGPSDFGSLLLSAPVVAGLEAAGFRRPSPVQLKAIPLGRCGLVPFTFSQRVGRIKQLIELDYLNTASIRLFILDEADKLLEEGSFQEQINWIYSSLPANKQMLAVSATYPESLANALTRYMREPTFVRLNPTDPSLIGLKQYYKIVNSHPLPHTTFEEKTQHLQELFSKIPFNQALVFSNLHSRAQHLAEVLTSRGFPAECISGNMNQNQRLDAMAKLKQFHCRVLISTDLTSRGIDAEKVNLVINLDVPVDWETYMHRIGRAGRFGKNSRVDFLSLQWLRWLRFGNHALLCMTGTLGLSVTYCCRGEEENMMMKIAQKCNLQLLPLPEPIPPGMMDQFEDGEVEVKPVTHSGASVSPDTACLRPEEPVLQSIQNSFSEVPQPFSDLPGDKSSVEGPKKALKQKQIKKCMNSAKTEKGSRSLQTSSCHTEQRNRVKTISRADGQCNARFPDEEALRKSLPRIPCLSSFKIQQNNPWSFSDFVEDYEYFIKEGLEREVEILRSYSGPGEQGELPRNGDVEWKEVEYNRETVANGALSGDSDVSYSSRASSNSRENNSCCEAFSDRAEKSAVSAMRQGHAGFCSTPEKPQELSQVPEQNQVKKKVLKQNAKQKQSHYHEFPSPSRRKTEDDCSCSSWDDGVPHEAWSYKNYWKSYYQAWQNYYAAVSYYRRSYRQFNWMSAYHVNSVYLQELLKSDD